MLVYGLVLARRAWSILTAMPQQERAVQRLPVIKRTAKRFGGICLMRWCGLTAVNYYSDVESRRGVRDCKRNSSPEFADLYFAELCYVGGRQNDIRSLLRLHDARTGEVVAEEFILHSEGDVTWEHTRLLDHADEHGVYGIESSKPYVRAWGLPLVEIELPPSWWDRMRAKLP